MPSNYFPNYHNHLLKRKTSINWSEIGKSFLKSKLFILVFAILVLLYFILGGHSQHSYISNTTETTLNSHSNDISQPDLKITDSHGQSPVSHMMDQKEDSSSSSNNQKDEGKKQEGKQEKKLMFIGVLSIPAKFERRSLIRMTYLREKPDNIDFKFIFGLPNTPEARALLELENERYGDVMILENTKENMDEGKTYAYFRDLVQVENKGNIQDKYHFVMKLDDDVYLNFPNFVKKFSALAGTKHFFFGRKVVKYFMAGLGYILSSDLVQWIAYDKYPASHAVGQEDSMTASWLYYYSSKVEKVDFVSEDEEIYDFPESGKGWAHPYTPGTLYIHRLKDQQDFIKTARHFLKKWV